MRPPLLSTLGPVWLLICMFCQVPSVPVSEEDYSLGQTRSQLSPRSSEKYGQLMELLRQQHEVTPPPTLRSWAAARLDCSF